MEASAAQSGGNWVKAVCHGVVCHDNDACGFEACGRVRRELLHILTTPHVHCAANACSGGTACLSVRRLLRHWLQCKAPSCQLCAGVWGEISCGAAAGQAESCAPTPHSMTEAMQCTGGGDDPASTSKPMDGASTASSSQSDQQQPLSSSSPFSSSPSRPLRTPPPDEQYVHVVHFLELLVQCFVQKVPPACEHKAYLEWLQTGKQLWLHMLMDCPCTGDCAVPGCQNARAVLQHRLTCQAHNCGVCASVSTFFTRGPSTVPALLPDMEALSAAINGLAL